MVQFFLNEPEIAELQSEAKLALKDLRDLKRMLQVTQSIEKYRNTVTQKLQSKGK